MSSTKTTTKVYLAADGFGEDLKNAMKDHVASKEDYEVIDLGVDTYFDAALAVGTSVSNDDRGILVCGTGMGVGIMANKCPGIRAATVENTTAARFARAVNDANVLCLGQLLTTEKEAKEIVNVFLEQAFNSHPVGSDGQPASWWNEGVETFLATSKQGIDRVEKKAMSKATA